MHSRDELLDQITNQQKQLNLLSHLNLRYLRELQLLNKAIRKRNRQNKRLRERVAELRADLGKDETVEMVDISDISYDRIEPHGMAD